MVAMRRDKKLAHAPTRKVKALCHQERDSSARKQARGKKRRHPHKNKQCLCYACRREGHKISECPNKDNISSRPTQVQVSKKIEHEKANKIKSCLCYTCRRKGHLSMDCPMGNTPKLNLSINANLLRRPKNDTCARKVIGLPCASTKAIWVSKSLVTNHNGPNIAWVSKCA